MAPPSPGSGMPQPAFTHVDVTCPDDGAVTSLYQGTGKCSQCGRQLPA